MIMKSGKPWVAVYQIFINKYCSVTESPHLHRTAFRQANCSWRVGSIAAYKAADLTSELRKTGANVHVVMTESQRSS